MKRLPFWVYVAWRVVLTLTIWVTFPLWVPALLAVCAIGNVFVMFYEAYRAWIRSVKEDYEHDNKTQSSRDSDRVEDKGTRKGGLPGSEGWD